MAESNQHPRSVELETQCTRRPDGSMLFARVDIGLLESDSEQAEHMAKMDGVVRPAARPCRSH